MKRAVSILLAVCFLTTMVVGCSSSGNEPVVTSTPTPIAQVTDNTTGGTVAGTPADYYSNYLEVKSAALDRVSAKIDENDSLALTVGMTLLSMSMFDLYLIPITVIGLDEESSAMVLGMLGMEGIVVEQNGNVYSISYTDEEGNTLTLTCEYDIATDSMQSTILDGEGGETMFFEYVKVGSGYASQYYMEDEENGGYALTKSYFDESNIVACGFESTEEKPASIFKNNNLDDTFVENDETYIVLENGVLTVFEDGETQTY